MRGDSPGESTLANITISLESNTTMFHNEGQQTPVPLAPASILFPAEICLFMPYPKILDLQVKSLNFKPVNPQLFPNIW